MSLFAAPTPPWKAKPLKYTCILASSPTLSVPEGNIMISAAHHPEALRLGRGSGGVN